MIFVASAEIVGKRDSSHNLNQFFNFFLIAKIDNLHVNKNLDNFAGSDQICCLI